VILQVACESRLLRQMARFALAEGMFVGCCLQVVIGFPLLQKTYLSVVKYWYESGLMLMTVF
tara:strand:+ start:126 stop:311 length:186 start_codon:yes stop_codon:yes gene_type:complete